MFRVNFELATDHYCPGLSFNAALPKWHNVNKKTLSPKKDLLDMCIVTMLTATWLQAK
jgi:hypothetical protein